MVEPQVNLHQGDGNEVPAGDPFECSRIFLDCALNINDFNKEVADGTKGYIGSRRMYRLSKLH